YPNGSMQTFEYDPNEPTKLVKVTNGDTTWTYNKGTNQWENGPNKSAADVSVGDDGKITINYGQGSKVEEHKPDGSIIYRDGKNITQEVFAFQNNNGTWERSGRKYEYFPDGKDLQSVTTYNPDDPSKAGVTWRRDSATSAWYTGEGENKVIST